VRARRAEGFPACGFTTSMCWRVRLVMGFCPHFRFLASNALVCRASLLICRLRFCLVVLVVTLDLMAHKGSPVVDVVGGAEASDLVEVAHPEEQDESSSSGQSSDNGHENTIVSQEEESEVVDLSEASWSYVFGLSTITISYIREMASLRYFAEGDARAPREKLCWSLQMMRLWYSKSFFAAGLRMPPQPTLANILLKFWVQLHQLTPNTIMQLSKFSGWC
jgi:hypothetical protein